MSDLLQKTFTVFVRPYYIDSDGNSVYYKGDIFGPSIPESTNRYPLITNNGTGNVNSPNDLNAGGTYRKDPWFLHSTYTSYNQMRDSLKELIAIYGTSNVRCAVYIPIDYEVLPNK